MCYQLALLILISGVMNLYRVPCNFEDGGDNVGHDSVLEQLHA